MYSFCEFIFNATHFDVLDAGHNFIGFLHSFIFSLHDQMLIFGHGFGDLWDGESDNNNRDNTANKSKTDSSVDEVDTQDEDKRELE